MNLASIIRDTDPLAQSFDPAPEDFAEIVEESFCLACQAPVARFESHGGALAHYAGDPMNDYIQPYQADHAPFLP